VLCTPIRKNCQKPKPQRFSVGNAASCCFTRLETRNWNSYQLCGNGPRRHVMEDFREALREVTGAKHVLFAPSCRMRLQQILMMLPNEEVVDAVHVSRGSGASAELAENDLVYRRRQSQTIV